MHVEFIARLCTERRPLVNSDLVFEGQGHSRHPHSRVPRPSLSLAIPTAVDLLQLVRYRPEKPAPTSSCRFVGKHWNALRSCEPASPTSRRSAPRPVGSDRLSSSVCARLPLSVPGSSWNPGICRRLFKIRLTLRAAEKKKNERKRNRGEAKFRNSAEICRFYYCVGVFDEILIEE